MKTTKHTLLFFLLFSSLFFTTCKKDTINKIVDDIPPIILDEAEPPFPCEDTACDWLKPEVADEPNFIGYYGKRSLVRVFYDKQDKNILYYNTIEEVRGPLTLWKYNRATKTRIWLADNMQYDAADINSEGWLVFNKNGLNVFVMKSNGDSLKQLTFKGIFQMPRWSNDGKSIFVSKDNKGIVYKLNKEGKVLDSLLGIYGTPYCVKNYVYFLKIENNKFVTKRRNVDTGEEELILSASNSLSYDAKYYFTDAENTTLYWGGDNGFCKTDLSTLKTTNIIDAKYESNNATSFYSMSPFSKRILAVQTNYRIIDFYNIENIRKILEYTPDGACRRSVEIVE